MTSHEAFDNHAVPAEHTRRSTLPSVLVLGMSTFKGVPQRDQQLATALASEGCEVDYIEIPVSMAYRIQAFRQRLRNPLGGDRHNRPVQEKQNLRIHFPPSVLTGFRRSYTRGLDIYRFRRWFRSTFQDRDFSQTVVLCMLPTWWYGYFTRDWLKPSMLIYDVFDDLDVISPTRRSRDALLKAERIMRSEVDLLTCSAHMLEMQINERFPSVPVCVIPNAVSEEFISLAGLNYSEKGGSDGEDDGSKGVGFLGTLEPAWFDTDLVMHLMREIPEQIFHLIGPVPDDVRRRLEQFPNVKLYGMRDIPEALDILSRCRVAIIPFLKNAITDVVNPLKLYEYSAAGLPVITTATAEMKHYASSAILVSSRDEWVREIREARTPDTEQRGRLHAFAQSNTWNIRARALLRCIGTEPENE